jgi:hypothetical protein
MSVTTREWHLDGLTVTQLRLSYQVELVMWSGERTLGLVLEAPFAITWGDGSTCLIEPERPETHGPLLQLLHKPVSSFVATSVGECILSFGDYARVSARPDQKYEAWNSYGEGLLKDAGLLCGPGGGRPWAEGAA